MFMENYLPQFRMRLGWCEVVPIRCWFLGQGTQTRLGGPENSNPWEYSRFGHFSVAPFGCAQIRLTVIFF